MSDKNKGIYKDERFAHLMKNPRFNKLPNRESKVKIDDRFKSMLEDDRFTVKYTVDKYGRKVNQKSNEDLKKYYELSSSEDSEDEKEEDEEIQVEGNALIKGENKIAEDLKNKLMNLEVDYIRGEGVLQSDSSDESSSEDDEENAVDHGWGNLDQDAERTEDSSKRIACMHMDWDRIRAVDIMILCNSFIPTGAGSVLSVKIYPSEFGKERLADEEMKGPKELTTIEPNDSENEEVDEESEEYREKLRQYQLNRLKYYYAVVEFDSIKSADIFYKECDGLEYESTANKLDLRFIPDELEFDDEPKDSCTELPDLSSYEPRIFFTSALQHAKVELTWDETDVSRKEISDKLFADRKNEISEHELKKFVAFSSDESEGSEHSDDEDNEKIRNSKNKIDVYKSLLDDINQKEAEKKKHQIEMEYSWSIGGKGDKKISDEESAKEELTPFEQILEKKKNKKKTKKLARKEKFKKEGDEDGDKDGYSSSDFDDIDMNDPYFAEEFQNDEYEKPKSKKKDKKKKAKNDEVDESDLLAQKELELLLDDGNDEKSHFSLKKIQESEDMSSKKKKRKLKKLKKSGVKVEEATDNFKLNTGDSRFGAVFSNPEFNIDPTDASFKKTKGMEVLIQEKLKRRFDNEQPEDLPVVKKKAKNVELSMLVKNLKRKMGK